MKRAVVDMTVLVSAFLTKEDVSEKLLEEASGGAFVMCPSAEIIGEMWRRLVEPGRMRVRYDYADEEVEERCRDLERWPNSLPASPMCISLSVIPTMT